MAIDDNTSYELTGYQVKDLANKVRAKADSSSLASVATSGLYSDLTGTPTIPTVNNGTLTIKQNGTTIETFTANQSTNVTVDLAGGIYADDPTTPANPNAWVTSSDIDWSSIMTVLYDGGTTGTNGNVPLSESAANFSRIKIFYRNNDSYYNSMEVWDPNNKTVTLICDSAPTGSAWYGKVGTYSISGTTLTKNRSLQVSAGGTTVVDNVYIVVTRVEGWKI